MSICKKIVLSLGYVLHILEGRDFPFLTTHKSQYGHLEELNFISFISYSSTQHYDIKEAERGTRRKWTKCQR